ncbi:MAG: heavy-metal-associated domain-containing protein [Bacteroidota bacterium]|nr:heavy-metal-associated domain-containing protein [Bacteroidota bacterium]MDP4206670.1 heavy-metal-associated domain-containing protein [Bacteroidota bacterium]
MRNVLILALIAMFAFSCGQKKTGSTEKVATDSTKVTQLTLKVVGMVADTSEVAVENSIKALPGVVDVNATFADSTVLVSFNPDSTNLDAISKAITEKGFKVKTDQKTATGPNAAPVEKPKTKK